MKQSIDLGNLADDCWNPLSLRAERAGWILGLTTHDNVVLCRYQPDNNHNIRNLKFGHSNVRYHLVAWQPLKIPKLRNPKVVLPIKLASSRLQWWQKVLSWLQV